MSQAVHSERLIKSTPDQIFLAWTRALRIEQWLCDFATLHPRKGGRIYLWWNGDFYSAGEFIELVPDCKIKFSWHARLEPASSEVSVDLTPTENGTMVSLTHVVPDGDDWAQRAQAFKAEWDRTLPNLASLLETGLDRRIYDRPMLGIQISDFNAEIAKAAGIPGTEGIRLAEAVEGMGAHAAGLQKDDVLVEFDGKKLSNDFGSLALALQGKKGGDRVVIVFYRGAQKTSTTMELSKRPIPHVPASAKELGELARSLYNDGLKLLQDTFIGISELEADHIPATGEWSAKQVLAHLIHTERNWLANIDDLIGGYTRNSDDFGGNIQAHVNATVKAYGSIQAMLEELQRLAVENVSLLSDLPADFVTRKSDYLNLCNTALNGMLPHTRSHVDQIRQALRSAKQ